MASLLQMRIVLLFFEAILLPAKSTIFSTPVLWFSWSAMSAKTLGTRILRHADLFLGGPRLPPEVVSACLNFSARGPKNLLLHGKNQPCRALYYWPACQNFGEPYPKWMSCKWALCLCRKWVVLHLSSNISSRNYNEKQVFHRHQIESVVGWISRVDCFQSRDVSPKIFLVLYQTVWNQPCLDHRSLCF